jgi:hypothetical protein
VSRCVRTNPAFGIIAFSTSLTHLLRCNFKVCVCGSFSGVVCRVGVLCYPSSILDHLEFVRVFIARANNLFTSSKNNIISIPILFSDPILSVHSRILNLAR